MNGPEIQRPLGWVLGYLPVGCETRGRAPVLNDRHGVYNERGTVNSMKSENGKTVVAVRGRGVRATPEQAREMCTCGHRASSHAALKYSCQAPGDHKGFCPCMRFLSAKEWRGSKAKAS